MRNNRPGDGTNTIQAAGPGAITDASRETGTGRPVSDGHGATAGAESDAQTFDSDPDPTELLGEIGDSLLVAYGLAAKDGDPLTLALLRKALLHTGRRLARGMSPAEAGIPCH
ncbi:hypothetical protein ACRBEV_31770 [Methylobacterium phyllosphaerae]